MDARDRLIVALDLPDISAAHALIEKLGDAVKFYKIGYQLVYAGGLPLYVDGELVGGAGASGGTPEQDEDCVREAAVSVVFSLG